MVRIRKARPRQTKIPDRYREGEDKNLDKHWQTYFLDKLAETSSISAAALYSGANPSRAYKLRRKDPDFARKWYAALLEGYEHLELETLRRLREGTAADGPKFDIANALRLLTLHRETVARERARIGNSDEASVLASLNAKLEAMRQNEHALEAGLAQDGTHGGDIGNAE
ncbi:MAG: hypothetical protein WC692_04130 [Erythrobacter sp.]|jgi:hypothetical protein